MFIILTPEQAEQVTTQYLPPIPERHNRIASKGWAAAWRRRTIWTGRWSLRGP